MTTMTAGQAGAINLDMAPWAIRNALQKARDEMGAAADAVTTDSVAQAASGNLARILRSWRVAHASIWADEYSSNAIKAAAVNELQRWTLQSIDDLERNFDIALKLVQDKLIDPAPPMNADDAMRRWRRLERQLDAGVDLKDILADAGADDLRVMAEELRSWRRSKMPTDIATADQATAADMVLVNERRYQLADPAQRQRMDFATATQQGGIWTHTAIEHARHHVKHSTAKETLTLPTWAGGAVTI